MPYNPTIHHRHSIRLKGYDYSQPGAYFVTICAHNREGLFGEITGVGNDTDNILRLNEFGKIVEFTWFDLVNHVTGIELGEFVVMPNHIHGIIVIGTEPACTRQTLSEMIRQLKTFSARQINEERHMPDTPVWQRGYWEHVIRDEEEYDAIATYILNNPAHWQEDQLYHGGDS